MLPSPRDDDTLFLPSHTRRAGQAPPRGPVKYRVLDEIARGGMGAVLRVHDPELDRVLALKVLLEDHLHHPEMHRRFLDEARICSQLQHPGVVPVHDIGTFADGRPFFTMKLVVGRTLAELLRVRPTPAHDLRRFLAAFEQVCQTMAYVHSRGVFHRDLKPSNVMLGEFGEVQVMDWGVAKVMRPGDPDEPASSSPPRVNAVLDQTLAGSVVGTPAYMAPEQARGETLDERADVFGLGAILCEILTGLPPYTAVRGSSTSGLGHERDLTDAHDRLEGCGADRGLIDLARACLADDPDGRPADAGDVARGLAAHRAGVDER
ncbi:MAG: serine/threonine-protein kinase, partial [Gemmataceae bacterium]